MYPQHRDAASREQPDAGRGGGRVEIERVGQPWMVPDLFDQLWLNATQQVSSSCTLTKYRTLRAPAPAAAPDGTPLYQTQHQIQHGRRTPVRHAAANLLLQHSECGMNVH
ncbi:hypothetical protein PHYPSEUDO_012805 [Phytophthora pseudosyringae]|uniref:Uncharacterized protein n=1 Tax=Phytophthora pseudosyringae TaxID=221518 RepID=A0A8T1W9A5_9STRA|nr:hypothetical protein PHYPSEUDO_012805 [Phytophthora pseudosyringae]